MNDQVSEAVADANAEPEVVRWRHRFRWHWRYILPQAFVLLVLLFYAILPALLGHAAAAMASRLGLGVLDVETGHPRPGFVTVRRLDLSGPGFRLQARDGRLTYDLGDLIRARLESVAFEVMELTLVDDQQVAHAGDGAAVETETVSLAEWSSRLPFVRARVETLRVQVPELALLASGELTYGDNRFALTLRGEEPEAASRFELDAEISGQGRVSVGFRERDGDRPPFLSAVSTLEADALLVDSDVRLSGYALQLAGELAGLPAGQGLLQGELKTRIPWPLPADLDWRGLNASGSFDMAWQSVDDGIRIEALAGTVQLQEGVVEAAAGGTLALDRPDLSLVARLPQGYGLRFDGARVEGGPGMEVDLRGVAVEAQASVSRFALTMAAAPGLEWAARVTARADGVNLDGRLEAAVRRSGVNGYAGPLSFAGAIAADDVRLASQVESDLTLAGDFLSAEGVADAGALGDLTFSAGFDLETGAGSATVTGATQLRKPFAASMLARWREPWDLDAGRLGYDLDLDWDGSAAPAGRVTVSLVGVDAHYRDFLVRGLNGEFELRLQGDTWTFGETPLTAESVDVGFVASNLSAFVAWTGSHVTVREFSAALLGGGVVAEPFSYFPGTGYGSLELRLVELNLSEVLALEGDEVTGTGRLNGVIPISLLDDAISIKAGKVQAAPPGGTIRVSTELSGPTGQAGLDFALLALKNFDYTLLEAEVDYAESGDLQLAVHLQGRNPEVEAGRPIHYNLNISENIPVLLKSLRLQDQVIRRVERRVRN